MMTRSQESTLILNGKQDLRIGYLDSDVLSCPEKLFGKGITILPQQIQISLVTHNCSKESHTFSYLKQHLKYYT